MLFNSLEFAVFLPVVVGLYFCTPWRFRWLLLLAASYGFYASWRPEYLLLIVVSTGVDHLAARRMAVAAGAVGRRAWLCVSLAVNLGLLFAFKYYDFAIASVNELLSRTGAGHALPTLDVLLPVGISFYTFQTLSYTIDVYRGVRPPYPHLGRFATYVAFFPQLVAGPIERSTRLLPQFDERHAFDRGALRAGAWLLLWGFFKKLVIADQAALLVDAVYADPEHMSGLALLIATHLFAFQIYCDFSGYSDIAIGSAQLMGFRLMRNFDRPYAASSVAEFWRRWHISLSTWFRDYLYIPLGGNRSGRARWVLGIVIVFLASGLWHGASWTFVTWGALHAGYLLAGRAKDRLLAAAMPKRPSATPHGWARRALRVAITYHLVLLGWVFFRAPSLSEALAILGSLRDRFLPDGSPLPTGFTGVELGAVCLPILLLLAIEWRQGQLGFERFALALPFPSRVLLGGVLLFGIACLGVFESHAFIYFQF